MCVRAIGSQEEGGDDMGERSQEVLGLELCGGGERRRGGDSLWLTSHTSLHARHFTFIISNV